MFDIHKFVVLDDKIKLPKSNYIWIIIAFLILLLLFSTPNKKPTNTQTQTDIINMR